MALMQEIFHGGAARVRLVAHDDAFRRMRSLKRGEPYLQPATIPRHVNKGHKYE
jgi:hypothetical protein